MNTIIKAEPGTERTLILQTLTTEINWIRLVVEASKIGSTEEIADIEEKGTYPTDFCLVAKANIIASKPRIYEHWREA